MIAEQPRRAPHESEKATSGAGTGNGDVGLGPGNGDWDLAWQ